MQVFKHESDLGTVETKSLSGKVLEGGLNLHSMRSFESADATKIGKEFTTGDVFQDQVQVSLILTKSLHCNLKRIMRKDQKTFTIKGWLMEAKMEFSEST